MFKHIKLVPVLALALATLAPAAASAKVPFRANAERAPQATTQSTNISYRTASLQRFGKARAVVKAERLEVCTHSHRYSTQHRM
jgi:hypothetical protein